ncbi:MAG: uncharacterized protein A8A55_0082 [Amphiamblys sp. WSBS2006]|nr:MAG: uncharacterized protein A8A55_0082 [Amphiamblys sp. WSBS2006]
MKKIVLAGVASVFCGIMTGEVYGFGQQECPTQRPGMQIDPNCPVHGNKPQGGGDFCGGNMNEGPSQMPAGNECMPPQPSQMPAGDECMPQQPSQMPAGDGCMPPQQPPMGSPGSPCSPFYGGGRNISVGRGTMLGFEGSEGGRKAMMGGFVAKGGVAEGGQEDADDIKNTPEFQEKKKMLLEKLLGGAGGAGDKKSSIIKKIKRKTTKKKISSQGGAVAGGKAGMIAGEDGVVAGGKKAGVVSGENGTVAGGAKAGVVGKKSGGEETPEDKS